VITLSKEFAFAFGGFISYHGFMFLGKRIKSAITVFSLVALLVLAISPVFALEPPKGLADRGPLTKMTFIHYKRAFAKPPWAGGGGSTATKCYSFLAKGAKWKTAENYVINPTNSYGLGDAFVENAVAGSASVWEDASSSNIFGSASLDTSVTYNESSSDEVNTLSFGSYPEANVIAVTNVWGYFGGPPQIRELVEWDMLLNTGSSWSWGDALVDPSLMDVENIVAHEIGHAAGMGHPDSTCTLETMYAYSSEGEIIKRDLHDGDVQGILELYK